MAVNGRRIGIARSDIEIVADRFRVPNASEIVFQVLESVTKWRSFAHDAHVPDVAVDEIAADIELWSSSLR